MKNPFAFLSNSRRQAEIAAEQERQEALEREYRYKARQQSMSNLRGERVYHTLPKESLTSQIYHTL